MTKTYELLIFDWDGTLMDSAGHIVASIQAAASDMGLSVPDSERASYIIGLGLREALLHLFPELPEPDHPHLADRYRHHYLGQDHAIPLFSGAEAMLRGLAGRGARLAVATGKSRKGLDRALAYSGLSELFEVTRTADEAFSKPHPAMLEMILDETGVSARQALMIGDTTHDLQMARNAGMDSAGVDYGAHSTALLAGCEPRVICGSIGALAQWLNQVV